MQFLRNNGVLVALAFGPAIVALGVVAFFTMAISGGIR